MTAGKIFALLDGRFNVSIDDIRAAALPSLRHRIILNFEGEAEGITTEAVVRSILDVGRPARRSSSAPLRRPSDDDGDGADRRPPAPRAGGGAGAGRRSCRASSTRPSSTRRFLRQLERLLLLMRAPVRGGLKGGRRSVKRGQSVEFADFRDYALGDDLRQLDWNVLARLEKLFVKLFVEEEDVTITLLLDGSASMASGPPDKLQFAKRAAAALGYIGLASEDKVAVSVLGGRVARRRTSPCAAPAASSGCSPSCRRSSRPTARPTSSPRPATPPPS